MRTSLIVPLRIHGKTPIRAFLLCNSSVPISARWKSHRLSRLLLLSLPFWMSFRAERGTCSSRSSLAPHSSIAEASRQQVPCGNDNQKSKNDYKKSSITGHNLLCL